MLFCPICGHEVEDGCDFCGNCGADLRRESKHSERDVGFSDNSHKSKILVIILCVAVLVVLIVILAFTLKLVLNHKDGAESTQQYASNGFVSSYDGSNIVHFGAPNGEKQSESMNVPQPSSFSHSTVTSKKEITTKKNSTTTKHQITQTSIPTTLRPSNREYDTSTSRHETTTYYNQSTSERSWDDYSDNYSSEYYWEYSELCINSFDVEYYSDDYVQMSWDMRSNYLISDWIIYYYIEGDDDAYWGVRCADECKNVYYGFITENYCYEIPQVSSGDVVHFVLFVEDISGEEMQAEQIVVF